MTFDDIGASNGVSQTNAQYVSWGTGIYDFDNDGLLDILIFHGGLIHLIPQEHTLFRGLGERQVRRCFARCRTVLSVRTTARGACFADYDNDGKVDAFVVNLGAKGRWCITSQPTPATGLPIKLKGDQEQSRRYRREVEVFAGGKRWTAERVAASGYLSQDDGRLHFGLGAATAIDKLHRSLAQRARTDAGKAGRGSRAHRGGAEVSWREPSRSTHSAGMLRWRLLSAAFAGIGLWTGRPRRPMRAIQRAMRSTTLRRLKCCSRPTARGSTCSASRAKKSACWMRPRYAVIKNIAVGRVPRGFSLSPDGARLFVTNTWDDTLSVIDTRHACRDGNVAGGRGAFERG